MKHYGDIKKMNGAEIEKVDVITFGAPCQDLSIAGKRMGMKSSLMGDDETTRSGLFFDAMRIIREMREDDKRNGRTDDNIRPRFGIYENVYGAFSSNKGADFKAVLDAFVKVADENAPDVPMPKKWTKAGCLYDEMERWSIAWRTHDAQYWGVPQRRRRICVLADWGGLTAGEILFEYWRETEDSNSDETVGYSGADGRREVPSVGEGLHGYPAESGEAWQGTSGDSETGIGEHDNLIGLDAYKHHGWRVNDVMNTLTAGQNDSVRGDTPLVAESATLKIRSGCEGGGKGALVQWNKSATLSTSSDQTLFVLKETDNDLPIKETDGQ